MRRSGHAADVPPWTLAWRKLTAFRTVAQRASDIPDVPVELLDRIAELRAGTPTSLAAKTRAMWTFERLGCTFGRVAGPGDTLGDLRLPAAASPITHVGMGVAAVESTGFDREELTRVIDSLARPVDRLFAFESVGAMLGAYERVLPRRLAGLRALKRPDPGEYIPTFEAPIRRLIGHGFGRLIYFESRSLKSAIADARARGYLDVPAAVQGIAFAHAMVNHRDLPRVLESSIGDAELDGFVQAGLVQALVFWEWLFPGTLESAEVPEHGLVRRAKMEVAGARERGRLDAFGLLH